VGAAEWQADQADTEGYKYTPRSFVPVVLRTSIFVDARLSKSGDAGLAGAKTGNSIRRGTFVVNNIILIDVLIRMGCGNLFERKERRTRSREWKTSRPSPISKPLQKNAGSLDWPESREETRELCCAQKARRRPRAMMRAFGVP